MTTRRLMKALVDGKELICKWEMRGNEPVEPIYAKLNSCGELSFRHKDSSYLIDNFGNLFPQFYPFTRITSRDWKVVQEVKPKRPIEWYELYPATLDSEGIYKYDKYVVCNVAELYSDRCYDVIVSGYYVNTLSRESDGLITTTGNTIVIKDHRILPVSSVNLESLLYNFNF